MKKISMIFIFVALSVTALSQEKPLKGFFLPIEDNPYIVNTTNARRAFGLRDSTYNVHFIRFGAEVGGMQILYNKVEKEFRPEVFMKVGIGLRYAFYRVSNGVPLNYLSVNGFLFMNEASISVAVTASAFNLFGTNLSPSVGLNFDPSNLKTDIFPVAPLLNLTYNF